MSEFSTFLNCIRILLIGAAIAISAAAIGGEPIRLWDANGETLPGYGAAVRRLPPGTEIVLRDGPPRVTATIGKFLGNGNTSVVYELADGRAIRLAKGEGLSDLGSTYDAYLIWFADGAEHLEKTGTPVVKYFKNDSWEIRYLIVEKLIPPDGVPELYSLEDLVRGRVTDNALAERMTKALLEDFAPKTWAVRFVADMRTDQILFTSKGWLVADLSSGVRAARAVRDSTLFSSMGKLPIKWRLRLEKIVLRARREAELKGNFVQLGLAEARRCLGWLKGMASF